VLARPNVHAVLEEWDEDVMEDHPWVFRVSGAGSNLQDLPIELTFEVDETSRDAFFYQVLETFRSLGPPLSPALLSLDIVRVNHPLVKQLAGCRGVQFVPQLGLDKGDEVAFCASI
jgi:hypothetical protein